MKAWEERCREGSGLDSLKKENWVLVLWLKTQSINKRILYRIYTRELDGVPVTKCLPYIYLANSLCYTKPNLS